MKFDPPLVRGTLLRRYKRFLADFTLESGEEVTVHCPNPGAMLGLDTPGMTGWLSPSTNPKRKLPFGWKLVELETGLVGIDTGVPNRIVAEALAGRGIAALKDYETFRPEVRYGSNSRIDFLLTGDGLPDLYLEVKNVHLVRQRGLAEFPDCVTKRGAKHLVELANMVACGHRAIMLYLVQRTDCDRFRLADDLDPRYATSFHQARSAGVEAVCFDCDIDQRGITLNRQLAIEI